MTANILEPSKKHLPRHVHFDYQFNPANYEQAFTPGSLGTVLSQYVRDEVLKDLSRKDYDKYEPQFGAHPASATKAKDIHEIPAVFRDVIEKQQDLDGTEENYKIEFRRKFVDLDVKSNVITWCLRERRPGLFAQGKPNTRKHQEFTMHHRATYKDPHDPNHLILAYSQSVDNMVELCCWSQDADTADRMAVWLEKTFQMWNWYFKHEGINRVIFYNREADIFEERHGTRMYGRPLIYFVRNERIVELKSAILKKVIIDLSVAPYNKLQYAYNINKET